MAAGSQRLSVERLGTRLAQLQQRMGEIDARLHRFDLRVAQLLRQKYRCTGFAFVTFDSEAAVSACMHAINVNQLEYHGKRLRAERPGEPEEIYCELLRTSLQPSTAGAAVVWVQTAAVPHVQPRRPAHTPRAAPRVVVHVLVALAPRVCLLPGVQACDAGIILRPLEIGAQLGDDLLRLRVQRAIKSTRRDLICFYRWPDNPPARGA